ncbi:MULTISPECIES: DUF1090 domain-containing protein [unclassified Caballeronia]|jgi:hypothetical protein|uniref:DUF1090 domain-containing protein n=1 Tax=unclassified Caballeronia TaxID=2646786 RepID=UPI0020291448|nr:MULTISPECIES: DUF1090 domain-containing protein [unclassified Caballeronia]MDR5774681.1 DUF1090 domain-containing protein [Caballeronia sp. LZ002]MDR5799711.1 DUF1090 domain-containing protein [Caballeronia sp. LZ001]MDR5850117.1 DUF1090 domain-containing protein [Caballeronia sp. LZ003]
MKTAFKAACLAMAAMPLFCSAQTSCDSKRASIEEEITYARAHGNASRIDGLETALGKLNANCTEASLRNESQRKVASAQKKLAEREHDLQKAKTEGKSAKKIAERQRKVDEAHAELARAQTEAAP